MNDPIALSDELLLRAVRAVETNNDAQWQEILQDNPTEAAALQNFVRAWFADTVAPPPGLEDREVDALLDDLWAKEPATEDPFDALSGAQLRKLAIQLCIDKTVIHKLVRRQIEAATIPQGFLTALAKALGKGRQSLATYLAQPCVTGGAFYKAPDGPRAADKESFRSAIETGVIAETSRTRWLPEND